jgi:GTP-binding protein EngB required for normal cell division
MDSKKVARTAKKLCGRQKMLRGRQKSGTKRWRGPQMLASQTNCHTNIWTEKKLHGQQKSCADGKKSCVDGKKVARAAKKWDQTLAGTSNVGKSNRIVTPIYGQQKSCTDSKKVARTAKKVVWTAKKLRVRTAKKLDQTLAGTANVGKSNRIVTPIYGQQKSCTDSKKVARTAKKLDQTLAGTSNVSGFVNVTKIYGSRFCRKYACASGQTGQKNISPDIFHETHQKQK